MIIIKKLFFIIISSLLLFACNDVEYYEVEGVIKSTKCDLKGQFLNLDNGVRYLISARHCNISEGVKIKIIHNKHLEVIELIVDGTKKIKGGN